MKDVDEYKVMDCYEKGHTFIISNVFDLTEELRMFESAISDIFAFYPVKGNLYLVNRVMVDFLVMTTHIMMFM